MKIETIEIAGIGAALKALRLPYGLPGRSKVTNFDIRYKKYDEDLFGLPYDNDLYSASRKAEINDKDLTLMSTLVKRGDEHAKAIRGIVVYAMITAPVYWWCEMETYRAGHERLASNSTMHQDCKGLKDEELQDAKAAIPMGKELTKVDMMSYQCLRNIVRQRRGHRLPEWSQFIEWVHTLPFAEELILVGIEPK